jgi:hypothetical protein
MKLLFIALALVLTAFAAQAGEMKVKSFSQYELYGSSTATPKFAVNPSMGRAWIEVTVSGNDPEALPETVQIKVPGLSFDAQTNSIVIDFEGKITTCATLKTTGRSIFRQTEIKMTKSCKFEGRTRKFSYDNGFEIKKTSAYEIFLIVE